MKLFIAFLLSTVVLNSFANTKQIKVYEYETIVDFNNLYSLGKPVEASEFNIPHEFHKQYKMITRYYIPNKITGNLIRKDHPAPRVCDWGQCRELSPYSSSKTTWEDKEFKVLYELIDMSTGKVVAKDAAKLYLTSWGRASFGLDYEYTSSDISVCNCSL